MERERERERGRGGKKNRGNDGEIERPSRGEDGGGVGETDIQGRSQGFTDKMISSGAISQRFRGAGMCLADELVSCRVVDLAQDRRHGQDSVEEGLEPALLHGICGSARVDRATQDQTRSNCESQFLRFQGQYTSKVEIPGRGVPEWYSTSWIDFSRLLRMKSRVVGRPQFTAKS